MSPESPSFHAHQQGTISLSLCIPMIPKKWAENKQSSPSQYVSWLRYIRGIFYEISSVNHERHMCTQFLFTVQFLLCVCASVGCLIREIGMPAGQTRKWNFSTRITIFLQTTLTLKSLRYPWTITERGCECQGSKINSQPERSRKFLMFDFIEATKHGPRNENKLPKS